jgi:hypothetical protein
MASPTGFELETVNFVSEESEVIDISRLKKADE